MKGDGENEIYSYSFVFITFLWFASLVLKVFKEQIARIFTQDYKELKQMYPAPLHAWGGLTGSLATRRIADFQLRGTLKLDVYKICSL